MINCSKNMEGRLLFAPDPFIRQKWYGFKSGHCVLKGSFLNFTERSTFLLSKPEEYSIPLELCSVHSLAHPKKHLFEVLTSSGSKFNFIAGSKQDADKWISKIKERSSALMSGMNLSNSNSQSSQRSQPTASVQSCTSFLNRKKFQTSSKVRDGHMSHCKGRAISDGLKRYGSMILNGTFTHAGTFGVPLQFCKPSLKVKYVPSIIVICTEIIEERGLDHQGLYRVPGNTTHVNSLYHELVVSNEVAICQDDERWRDVNVIGSLLKLFFRKLPSPLITTELYRPAMEAIRKPSEEEKISALKQVLTCLPKHHYETFKHLALHLHRVAGKEDINKMNAHNLSIVFGPTLICSREENETARMVVDMPDQCLVVEVIIKNVELLFGRSIHTNEDEKTGLKAKQTVNSLELSFSDEEELFVHLPRTEIDVIFESNCENEDNVLTQEGVPPTSSSRFFSVSCANAKDAPNYTCEVHSLSNSLAGSSPLSSRGQSPFHDKQPFTGNLPSSDIASDVLLCKRSSLSTNDCQTGDVECDRVSEGGNRNHKTSGSLRGWTREKDATEHALQHLKRLSFDLRTFKHRLDIEKMEQLQRNVSRERIEREYERTLGEFGIITSVEKVETS